MTQTLTVSDAWLAVCGRSSLSGVAMPIVAVRDFGKRGKFYTVRMPNGHEWEIWSARGVTLSEAMSGIERATLNLKVAQAARDTLESVAKRDRQMFGRTSITLRMRADAQSVVCDKLDARHDAIKAHFRPVR